MTLAEYKSLNWAYIRKTRKSVFLLPIFFLLIIIVNITVGITFPRASNYEPKNMAFFGLFFILFVFLLFSRFNTAFKKNYANTPALVDGLTITLSEQSIAIHSLLINGEQPWPASFKRAVKIDKWIILSSGPTTAYFLNTEKIESPATLTDLAALLQHKGVKLVK